MNEYGREFGRMKVIVHDLQEKSWQELGMKLQEKDIVIGGDADGIGRDIGGLMGDCCLRGIQPVRPGGAGKVQEAFRTVPGDETRTDAL